MAKEPDSIGLLILRKIDQRTERMAEDLGILKVREAAVRRGAGAGFKPKLDLSKIVSERMNKSRLSDARTR